MSTDSNNGLFPTGPPATIEGVVERIVYENADNGFMVARLREEGASHLTTFVGNLLALSPGETVRLTGQWVDDKRFGRQLRVSRYETLMPNTADAIEKYLGSGLVRGVGPTYAKRLVKAFGVETLRVIDEHPERLRKVEGIGPKRAKQIREAWEAQKAIQSIMLFLQGHGIGVGQAVRIYKCYGDAAVSILRDNPYRLAEDISGIGFRSADAIARELGIGPESPKRAAAGMVHVLRSAVIEGHVYLDEATLLSDASQLLQVDASLLTEPLQALEQQKSVIREGEALFTPALHEAEVDSTRLVKRLLSIPLPRIKIDVERALAWIEKTKKITLSPEQADAIRTAVASKVMVITGGPGTGKTTVLNGLLDILSMKGQSILLAAPTGRAAKRLEAATGRLASTIHRMLEYSPKEGRFTRDEGNPLNEDLFVIDEASMVDITLLHSLLKALPPHARLIVVGDVDQLPSVGPGNVLLDLISSNCVPVVWLKTVFRQAEESGIVTNAHRINTGQHPEFNTADFFFVERKEPERALETIIHLVTERIPAKFGLDPKRDVQVLSPMHRGETGVARLNETLQQALNPGVEPVPRRAYGMNDKVMQLRNNYDLDVYNGDVGVVTTVDTDSMEVHVRFDDREALYEVEALDELTLAYAGTVHKAQGSEYPAVVMPLLTEHYMMLQRNILYTAVTRARSLVVIVGDPKALNIALRNTRITRRNTRLADRLRNAVGG